MASEFGESKSPSPQNPSFSGTGPNDAGDFECNICFDLAQDPIVTLCGHLFCWPCLYRWLHLHSRSQECPVCKALIEEEKLVPLYGRGKAPTDPRSKPVSGVEIPRRPAGQRPETAPPPQPNNTFPNLGFGLMGGSIPMATAWFGNFAIGGFFLSVLNFQVHRFSDGAPSGNQFGYARGFNGDHVHRDHHQQQQQNSQGQQADSILKTLFVMVGICVIVSLITV